jgi:hypothetical protein
MISWVNDALSYNYWSKEMVASKISTTLFEPARLPGMGKNAYSLDYLLSAKLEISNPSFARINKIDRA